MTAVDSAPRQPEHAPAAHRGGHLLQTLVGSIVCGFLAVVMSISFASVLLPPGLSAYLPVAAGLALFTTVVAALVSALTSDIRGAISIIQEIPLAVMASLAAPIAAAASAHAGPGETAATIFVALAIATILTGIVLLALGYFRFGGLVRYVPYPVMGGFLAGTGWLILGRASGDAGTGQLAALPLATKALAGRASGPLARAFGLDELGLGGSSTGAAGQFVTLGKRITDRLYVGFEQGLGGAESLLRLEFTLTQRILLRAQAGQTNSAGVFYRRAWD